MEGITSRQAFVLQQIIRLTDEKGFPPTLRELCEATDIRSTNGVTEHLLALERKGFLTRGDVWGRTRSIRLLPPSEAHRACRPVAFTNAPRATLGQMFVPFTCPNCNAETFARHEPELCRRLIGLT